ncbi:MAG TPA: hypothetical protein P5123_05320 [Spirochaetota bacterium]|nr:hypothetical protein [Spirochaetota bacterium]
MEQIEKIKLPLIKDYIKTIKSLAGQGRNYYHKFLVIPLSSWSSHPVDYELSDLQKEIEEGRSIPDIEKIAVSYKRALIRSVAKDQFDLTLPGKLSISYLLDIQNSIDLANRMESLQFVNLLRKPFTDYSRIEYNSMNTRFRQELDSIQDNGELIESISKLKSDEEEKLKFELDRSEKMVCAIKSRLNQLDASDIRKHIIAYLISTASPSMPRLHKDIDPVIDKIGRLHRGYKKEIYDSVAVIIYRELMAAVKKSDLRKAILLISKFTVLFRGNPGTPHFEEVDAFEKIFFSIIEKKNLWDLI